MAAKKAPYGANARELERGSGKPTPKSATVKPVKKPVKMPTIGWATRKPGKPKAT